MGWIKLVARLFENPENIITLIGTIISIILAYYFWKYFLKLLVVILKALAIIPMWIVGLFVLLIEKVGDIFSSKKFEKYLDEQETLRKEKVAQLIANNDYENTKNLEIHKLHEIIITPMTRLERSDAIRKTKSFVTEEGIELRHKIDKATMEDYKLNIYPIKEKEKTRELSYDEASRMIDEKYNEVQILDLEGLLKSADERFQQQISKL